VEDVREAVARVQRLLYVAWPKIQDIDWRLFGSLQRYGPDGATLKYQDGLLLVYSGSTLWAKCVFGSPSEKRVEEMTEIAERKVHLAQQSSHGYSAALRDPDNGHWAGGIKVPGSSLCFALTGLPEVADHSSLAHAMRRVRLITSQHLELLLDPNRAVGLAAALARVSLDAKGFGSLCRDLDRTL
jgi:hypothetical protein